MILVHLKGGLCNRLRTMLGFLYIARKRGERLKYVWKKDMACNGNFHDYFENMLGMEQTSEDFFKKNRGRVKISYTGQAPFYTILTKYGEKGDIKLMETIMYNELRLKPAMKKELHNRMEQFGIQNCVGVHVRRTDHVQLAKKRTTTGPTRDEEFFQFIDAHGDSKVFFATDNPETQSTFKKKYGDRIQYHSNANMKGLRKTSLGSAIIDLYLLANCKTVKGSIYSSFSETAVLLSRCPNKSQGYLPKTL